MTASGIFETDNLFVYNYKYNKLYSFPTDETNYHFGFASALNQLPQDSAPNDTRFVYIGKKSPFSQQQLTLLNWQKISNLIDLLMILDPCWDNLNKSNN